MANKINSTAGMPTDHIASEVDNFVAQMDFQRRGFERRAYDNNFFDDGFHFRYVSRTTGHIVDAGKKDPQGPTRAIPKASRQIRGVANLLLGLDPHPVVYPEKVSRANFMAEQPDPKTGKMVASPEYKKAMEVSKDLAKRQGHWLEEEWRKQELMDKLTFMVILAAKHGVSYLQILPDPNEQKIVSVVRDFFDVYTMGNMTELDDSPMVVMAAPELISKLKANPLYKEEDLARISPDNRYASSEVKQAYMQVRFGSTTQSDSAATLIQKEAYILEYINDDNMQKIATDLGDRFRGKKRGDKIIRQVCAAGGVTLYDKYLNLGKYPLVDFRFEPGPMYQVPFIERFIPANKSLDISMSRIERYLNTMNVGVIMKRKGENFSITNQSGAQTIEFETTPPTQMNLAPLPASVFNFIGLLNQTIEEQGASVSTLNQLPQGVESGKAIESAKATEYANLKIPSDSLKKTVRRISERLVDYAADYFVTPQTVYYLEKGEPSYFDIIGQAGAEKYQSLNIEIPQDTVQIKHDTMVDIQIETGMGYTEQGKRESMKQIADYMRGLAQEGLLSQEAVKVSIQSFLETYGYGSTSEFIDAMDEGTESSPLTEDQITQMKVAVLEAMKESGEIGQEASDKRIMEAKIGSVEALKDAGLLDKKEEIPDNPEMAPIPYKDMPEDIKRQAEVMAGFTPSQDQSPVDMVAEAKVADTLIKAKQVSQSGEQSDKSMEQEGMMKSREMDMKEKMMNKPQPKKLTTKQ